MANRRLIVEIIGDGSSYQRALGRANRETTTFGNRLSHLGKSLVRGGIFAAAAAGAASFFAVLHEGTKEISENQQVTAQTAAVIKSTGGAAQVTEKQVKRLGLELSNLSGVDDEVVQAGENMLLSFVKIRNQVGKGNDIFTRATKTILDYSVRTGKDFPTAAATLGKALEDPAGKLGLLARVGIVFTKSQKDAIAALANSGHLLQAQKEVLRGLEERYKGAAAAAGKTLPGQLRILRERFKDLSGEILAGVVPATTAVVSGLVRFTRKLSELKGFRAKLRFTIETAGDLGARLLRGIEQQIERTDFRKLGRLVGQEVKVGLADASAALSTVDWGKVGGSIVTGITDFLKGVDWVGLFKGVVRLMFRAMLADVKLQIGLLKQLGRELIGAIIAGLEAAANQGALFVEKFTLTLIKKVIGAFGFLGRFDPFKGLGHSIEDRLAHVQKQIDALHGKDIDIRVNVTTNTGKSIEKSFGSIASTIGNLRAGLEAKISAANADQEQAALRAAAARKKAAARAAAAAAAAKKAHDRMQAAFQVIIDSLDLKLERAQASGSFDKQIAAQKAINTAIEKEIKLEGKTTDLERQLFEGRQALADLRKQKVAGAEFKALGLDETGAAKLPTVKQLSKRVGRLQDLIKGTPLDTDKTRSELARIAKVLSGQFGKVGKDVRSAILGMLNDIADALKSGSKPNGPITKFRVANFSDIAKEFPSLSPDDERRLQRLLARRGPGGTVAQGSRTGGAFGLPPGGQGGGGNFNVNGPVTIVVEHGTAEEIQRELQKKRRRTATSRTGSRAGGGIGV